MSTAKEPEFDYYTHLKEYKPEPSQIHRGPEEREKCLKAVMERKRIAQNKRQGDADNEKEVSSDISTRKTGF